MSGKGAFVININAKNSTKEEYAGPAINFPPGTELSLDKKQAHSFRPDKNEALEIRVLCSGILNTEHEVCVKPYDEYQPWVDYFKAND